MPRAGRERARFPGPTHHDRRGRYTFGLADGKLCAIVGEASLNLVDAPAAFTALAEKLAKPNSHRR